MKRLLAAFLTLLLCCVASVSSSAAQDAKPPAPPRGNPNAKSAAKRGPVFRSTRDQIKQAQVLLKARGFYSAPEDGKLNDDTRAALKKYQEAEKLKVTGTLNKATLERMGVTLTGTQKEWKPMT